MSKKLRPILGLIIIAGFLLTLFVQSRRHASHSSAGASQVIRIGTNRALGTVTPYISRDKGFYEQQGLQVEIVDFNDVTTLMEAFASGQLDVALVGIAPSAIWQAKGVGLKVVASANGGGHVLLTRTDSGINDVKGIKGKKIATPKPGTVTDTLFRAHIVEDLAGLDPDKDIQIVPNMAAADMPTVLFASREVDAAISWEPFASQAEANYKNARVLYDASAAWRKENPDAKSLYPVNVVIARQGFIDQRPGDLRRLLIAHVRTVAFINQDIEEANGLISNETKLDKTIIAAARRRIDYTAYVDTAASLKTLEWSARLGYLKAVPNVDKLFDLNYLPKE